MKYIAVFGYTGKPYPVKFDEVYDTKIFKKVSYFIMYIFYTMHCSV